MKLYDVYSLFDIEPIRGEGCKLYTADGQEYLDFYGGHAVISIGHSHPRFNEKLKSQIDQIIFYSNSVKNNLQLELAKRLGVVSGCSEYELFLCNSGAEAIENALKLASFNTGKSKVIAFQNCFHGRTSGAVNITDNEKIKAPINKGFETTYLPLNDLESLKRELSSGQYAALVIEPIQGVGGLDMATKEFLQAIQQYCNQYECFFIADEVQSGFGRSGQFFAFQFAGVQPDIICMAKGMGNGFPIGGLYIQPQKSKSWKGQLGTTFGGNHLACQACLAVIDVIESESLLENTKNLGKYFSQKLADCPGVLSVKGRGLMLGILLKDPIVEIRNELLYAHHIFTGNSKNPKVIRILPPLNVSKIEIDHFIEKLTIVLSAQT